MEKFKEYIELICEGSDPLIVSDGFAMMMFSEDTGAVGLLTEKVGGGAVTGTELAMDLEEICVALKIYMHDNSALNCGCNMEAVKSFICIHKEDEEVIRSSMGLLYDRVERRVHLVGIRSDSDHMELLYDHLMREMERAATGTVSGALSSGFDIVEEDDRFMKAVPSHKPRTDYRLRSAFDYVSSGVFVFANSAKEEPYLHLFAKTAGISDNAIRRGSYEYYPYVTIRNRIMIPVKDCRWDSVISCKALLERMQRENEPLFDTRH
ncbi:hypothetical protein [Butyrivibrio sp. MC2013]|uniref:hypothetical protein n=1 Tax=Butyrivibrio sp. MC2013 TaxID=1280686 RepID=UPI000408E880|nr:hypothetical protein [Butyrivibrio sp. MC2013]